MNPPPKWIGTFAGLLGFVGVALGAFGAHALKDSLVASNTLGTWQAAVLYELIHAVALLAIARSGGKILFLRWIAGCWIAGIFLFSGSLYWLALGGPRFLGPITPLGGLAFLVGWLLVMIEAARTPPAA